MGIQELSPDQLKQIEVIIRSCGLQSLNKIPQTIESQGFFALVL